MTDADPAAPFVILDRTPRVLMSKMTEHDFATKGREMADVVGLMETIEADKKATAADFKAQLDAQEKRRDELARQLREGAIDVSVECEVRAFHDTEQIRVFRLDTQEEIVSERRDMTDAEKQRHLFPPTADDPHERGVIAGQWWRADERRPEPGCPFDPESPEQAINFARWRAGFFEDPDPTSLWSSSYEQGRQSADDETCPFHEDTFEFDRWHAGRAGEPDVADDWQRGADARRVRAVELCMASTPSERVQLALTLRDGPANFERWGDVDREQFLAGWLYREPASANDPNEGEDGGADGDDDGDGEEGQE